MKDIHCYSEECSTESLFKHHNILCVGTLSSQEHPLFKFKEHAILHNELFLLAAQVLSTVLSAWRANGGDLAQVHRHQLKLNGVLSILKHFRLL